MVFRNLFHIFKRYGTPALPVQASTKSLASALSHDRKFATLIMFYRQPIDNLHSYCRSTEIQKYKDLLLASRIITCVGIGRTLRNTTATKMTFFLLYTHVFDHGVQCIDKSALK